MRKIAIVFVLAIFLPSLLLAWLAIRSLRDQQFVLERQQSLLYQGVADTLAARMQDFMASQQRNFEQEVETILSDQNPREIAPTFDEKLRAAWPLAEVGFAVTLDGIISSPSLWGSTEGKRFRKENDPFLSNREIAEVYPTSQAGMKNYASKDEDNPSSLDQSRQRDAPRDYLDQRREEVAAPAKPAASPPSPAAESESLQSVRKDGTELEKRSFDKKESASASQRGSADAAPAEKAPQQFQEKQMMKSKSQGAPSKLDNANFTSNTEQFSRRQQARNVIPEKELQPLVPQMSRTTSAEAEFRQLVGDNTSGAIARFLQNKLKLMLWYRSPRDPQLVFGAQLRLDTLTQELARLLQVDPSLKQDIGAALLDDNGKPVAQTKVPFTANWKHPFVATEIGDVLPHWEIAVYLLNPDKLNQTAQTLKLTLGLMVALLLFAIVVGGWLISSDIQRQIILAKQKTDFVSNVSHELKTPLTSIRMFSELLSSGRVHEADKQRSYLQIISTEAARLTRLINNVLDFAKLERGEKKYDFQPCDIVSLVNETVENYRPHLETGGFKLDYKPITDFYTVRGDRDALSQVLLNLFSNAEKYGGDKKEISVEMRVKTSPLSSFEVRVQDRGDGVPRGSEEKIFEQFYRAHDSLSSGIQGSGLGLTLARQIARAHGGDVTHHPREGGGSCFTLTLPIQPNS